MILISVVALVASWLWFDMKFMVIQSKILSPDSLPGNLSSTWPGLPSSLSPSPTLNATARTPSVMDLAQQHSSVKATRTDGTMSERIDNDNGNNHTLKIQQRSTNMFAKMQEKFYKKAIATHKTNRRQFTVKGWQIKGSSGGMVNSDLLHCQLCF